MKKYVFVLLALIAVYSCNSRKESGAIAQTGSDNKSNTYNSALQDTMILDDKTRLLKTPDSQGEILATLDRCTVIVLDKKPVPNVQTSNVVDTFIKIQTKNNEIGYIWKDVLITLSQLRAHNDSLAMWASQPMPLYDNLIGTTYFTNNELPFELSPGAFISVGQESRYGIVSFSNRYTDRYSYLFFVENTGRIKNERDNELKILDIRALDWEVFGQNAQPWFQQCACVNQNEDCTEVVAVYQHTEEMARQEIMVTPLKAWRPDYTKKSLVEIGVETVKCGSMAPEDNSDYNG